MAGEPAANSAVFGRVDAQEKVGCWCTTVEGIEAEVKAISQGRRLHREQGPAAAQGLLLGAASTACQCTPSSRLWPTTTSSFAAPFAQMLTAAALNDSATLTRALLMIVSVSVSPSCLR